MPRYRHRNCSPTPTMQVYCSHSREEYFHPFTHHRHGKSLMNSTKWRKRGTGDGDDSLVHVKLRNKTCWLLGSSSLLAGVIGLLAIFADL